MLYLQIIQGKDPARVVIDEVAEQGNSKSDQEGWNRLIPVTVGKVPTNRAGNGCNRACSFTNIANTKACRSYFMKQHYNASTRSW